MLIKIMLQSVPTYIMNYVLLPRNVMQTLEVTIEVIGVVIKE